MEMMLRAESNAVSIFVVMLVEETNTNTVFVNPTNITTNSGLIDMMYRCESREETASWLSAIIALLLHFSA